MPTNLHNDNDIITGDSQFYENVKDAGLCRNLLNFLIVNFQKKLPYESRYFGEKGMHHDQYQLKSHRIMGSLPLNG